MQVILRMNADFTYIHYYLLLTFSYSQEIENTIFHECCGPAGSPAAALPPPGLVMLRFHVDV